MPSWTSRLLHASQPSNAPQTSIPDPSRPAKHECNEQMSGPVSSPQEPNSRQLPGSSSRHGRSLSHPLTSLLGQGRKIDLRSRDGGTSANTGAQKDSVGCPKHDMNRGGQPDIPHNASLPSTQDSDLMSGRCATCGSLIKWPKRLTVFRCTICLMVNDLRPSGKRRPDGLPPQKRERPNGICLSTTKQIISHCIQSHLHSFIVLENDNEINLPGKGNMRSYVHQALQVDSDEVPIDPGDIGAQSIPFGDRCDTSECRHARTYLHDDASCSPSSWPMRNSRFRPGKATTIDAASPPTSHPLAVVQGSSMQRMEPCDQPQQSHIKVNSDSIFRPLEDYIVRHLHHCDHLNDSFCLSKSPAPLRSVSEGCGTAPGSKSHGSDLRNRDEGIFEMDEKTLLLGDVAENGAWWLGKHHTESIKSPNVVEAATDTKDSGSNVKPPRTDWIQLQAWYEAILCAGHDWSTYVQDYPNNPSAETPWTAENLAKIQYDINKSRTHLRRTLLKATESLLRRPGRPLKTLGDCRFLLLLIANPLLYSARSYDNIEIGGHSESATLRSHIKPVETNHAARSSPVGRSNPKSHTGIVKRILGLMANLSQESHRQLISWFARFPDKDFRKLVDLVGGFVTHRLVRQRQKLTTSHSQKPAAVLVPEISGPGAGTSAQLHAALGTGSSTTSPETTENKVVYCDDWQVKAAAKVMSLLFQANNSSITRRQGSFPTDIMPGKEQASSTSQDAVGPGQLLGCSEMSKASLKRAHKHGQLLPTSAFYNTLLDYCDLVADFEAWENRRASFSFCQYPMFLSLWAKIRILEHDARRQMEIRARQAFFNSIMRRSAVSQYLLLKVRRECLVDDSLRAVSEIVGSGGQEEVKKSLRIAFQGEEGVDAGGLRKEWFLLLVREIFDPEHGMFVYDEDSQYCYFNPHTYETSDQYFLVGVLLGLAIYNSTILDVALPPFVFRKLLASAPTYTGPVSSLSRPSATHTLGDLAEFRPALASGLQKLLEYDGDVEATFCRDFVIESDRYGQAVQVPLCPGGEGKAVTNDNRGEFVELYIKYLLDSSVSRQFEPFKRGFFSVCGGNALSLFRPEEIELLVRGSDEALDVATLRAVAVYDGWKQKDKPEEEAVIAWFWEVFAEATAREQRALLSFITGSDRLPAMGVTSLIIKISCLGDDVRRFPVARTCFNMLGLCRYRSKERLRSKLWMAVNESEGFGLK